MSETKRPTGKSAPRKPRAAAPRNEEVVPPVEAEIEEQPFVEEAPFRSDKRLAEPETEADIYTLQVFFDQAEGVYRAGFLEFPELRLSDVSRKEAIYGAEDKLYSHLAALRQSGQPVPQPIRSREYPSKIELPISQTLFRKLEARRYQERVSLEQLIIEILTATVDRKPENTERQGGGHHQGRGGRSQGGQQGKGRQQGGRGGAGRRSANYHETMDSRENFMEYVRNLEKGGGPGYKKR